jgi:hypothetical protein
MKTLRIRNIVWAVIALSLALGAILEAVQPRPWWNGWLGFAGLALLGLAVLFLAWRWSGGGRMMGWMIGLALTLRLASGVATYLALPIDGYDVPDDKAGFVFTDAHRRDDQAWELAQSGKSLLTAFDKTYYTDQYGGLLGLSALTYRVFSPDAHRPLIIVLLAALTAALGIPFFFQATRLLWDVKLASVATWLSVLYPESILTGGAQMREPFLLTLIAITLWGFAQWLGEAKPSALWWIAGGIGCMLLISPGMSLVAVILLVGWVWLRGEHRKLPWPIVAAAVGAILIATLFLAWSVSRQYDFSASSPIGILLNWFRDSVKWVVYELERGSGQIQNVFSKLNPAAQFAFVLGYGVAQPVLPPAFLEPTTLTWHIIAVARAVGWYVLLPWLLYAIIAAWKSPPGPERRVRLWLAIFAWAWIVICAIRAGGDQWDNPRYRLIFLGVEAVAAAYAWIFWREHRDSWLPRIIALEVLCVLVFGQWYVARYYLVGIHLPILVVLTISLSCAALILLGGWLWDSVQAQRRPQTDETRKV